MEANNDGLKQMLPQYTPPEKVWESVTKRLDGASFYDLPLYTPRAEIWNTIEVKLRNRTRQYRRLQWLGAAAAVLCIGIFLRFQAGNSDVVVKQEVLDNRLQISAVSEADSQYEEFMEICLAQSQLCRQPDFTRLRKEFEILREATSELRNAAGVFNRDRKLVEEHTSLELKKAEILNEMVKFI